MEIQLLGIPVPILILISLALVFDFFNGFHDSSNIVATMIASTKLWPRMPYKSNSMLTRGEIRISTVFSSRPGPPRDRAAAA